MAIALAAVTFFSTGLGGLVAFRFRDRLHVVMSLASGAVLGVVFFDMLPETFAHAVPRWILVGSAAGFLVYFLLERFTSLHAAREHEHHATAPHAPEVGMVGAGGLSIHSFLDGVAIGVGFHAGFAAGILIALAVITHDFSDGLNTMTVMLAHGNTTRRSIVFLLMDMSTPLLGALSTVVVTLPASVLPWLLAFFAGSFLYIGASDLLPEAREHKSWVVTVMPIVGFALIFAATRFLP